MTLGPARVGLLAGLLASAVALPSVRNGFVQDDAWVVQNRHILMSPPSAAALLREPFWPRSFGGSLWRPLVLASWALDYRVSSRPAWFHVVNVVWAGVAAGLLAALAVELAGVPVGLIAGLLFAVHPVHVEAASSIVGRAELMAAAGYAIALLCALRAERSRWALAGVVLGAALAIGSKEHAATLPVAVVLVLLWKARPWRAVVVPALAAAVPIALYFLLRGPIAAGALNSGGLAPGLEGLGMAQRAVAMAGVSLEWWRLLLFPLHLSADWSTAQVPVIPFVSSRLVLAATLWLAAGIAAWQLRGRLPALWLGLAWFLLTIAPVANVLVPTEVVLAERTLYLPSFGAMLAVACGLSLVRAPRVGRAATAAIVVLFGARAVARNQAWLDPAHAFAALQHDAPRSYRTLWLRGDAAFATGQPATGERLLEEATVAAPGIPGPVEDLAGHYAAAGLTSQAVAMLRHAMTLNETRTTPWLLIQDVEFAGRDTAEALRWARLADARFPADPRVVNQSLGTLLRSGRCEEAGSLLVAKAALFPPAGVAQAQVAIARCH